MTEETEQTINRTELDFVLYVRKSTEDEGSQVHSIEDQRRICEEYAEREGDINIVEVIEEKKSAKKANNRPEFSKMLKGLKNGKYQGVIAYHPDRLSRNMLEAGVVLDMLSPDNGVIKSLVFPTVHYHNDSSGRLTLAVLFSLATQYSEHLAEMVSRGIKTNLKKGLSSGTPKWGYSRSEVNGRYEPDKNFPLIRKGWEMLLDGKSQKEIVAYWKKAGVERKTKITRKNKVITTKHISEKMTPTIFRDSFFFGVLHQSEQDIDLRSVYNFKPMITEEEYDKAQTKLYDNRRKSNLSAKNDFLPFKGMVFCGICGGKMYVGASGNKKTAKERKVYYDCQKKDCRAIRKANTNHSGVRGQVILEQLYAALDGLKMTKNSYEEYSKAIDHYTNEELEALRMERRSLIGSKNQYKADLEAEDRKYGNLAAPEMKTPTSVLETARRDIERLQSDIIDLEEDIAMIDKKLKDPNQIKLSKEEFLNLIKTVSEQMKKRDFVHKDILARKLFLNFTLDDKNSLSYLCKPEFKGLLKMNKIQFGAPD